MTTFYITRSIGPNLQKVSYKGVEFLFLSHSQNGGRKLSIKEYPLRDTRTATDLGRKDYSFQITGTFKNADDYLNSRKRLINALQSKGSGIFNHPFEGPITAVVQDFNISETQRDVGYGTIDVTFIKVKGQKYPTTSDVIDASQIFSITNQIINQMRNAFISGYSAINQFKQALNTISTLSSEAQNSLFAAFSLVQYAASSVTGTIYSLQNVTSPEAPLSASTYFDNLNSAYGTTYNALDDPSAQATFNEANFGFKSSVLISDSHANITKGRIVQNTNIALINFTFNLLAFVYDLNATTQMTFSTIDDIASKKRTLANQYNFLIDTNIYYPDNTGLKLPLINNDLLNLIQKSKSLTYKYLSNLQSTTNKTTTIIVQRESLISLVYRIYGNLDNTQAILDLNKIQDPTNITGEIRIIST